jgi:hypothetical protein
MGGYVMIYPNGNPETVSPYDAQYVLDDITDRGKTELQDALKKLLLIVKITPQEPTIIPAEKAASELTQFRNKYDVTTYSDPAPVPVNKDGITFIPSGSVQGWSSSITPGTPVIGIQDADPNKMKLVDRWRFQRLIDNNQLNSQAKLHPFTFLGTSASTGKGVLQPNSQKGGWEKLPENPKFDEESLIGVSNPNDGSVRYYSERTMRDEEKLDYWAGRGMVDLRSPIIHHWFDNEEGKWFIDDRYNYKGKPITVMDYLNKMNAPFWRTSADNNFDQGNAEDGDVHDNP